MSHKSNMNVDGESHGRVVPAKCPNKDGKPSVEGMEERRPTKENTEQTTASQTQSRSGALSGLLGVREVAGKDKRLQFTALFHHVTVPLLLDSFYGLKRDAAPGVDGMTWKDYETDLDKRAGGFAWSNPSGHVSSATFQESLHTESGWTTTATGHCRPGG